MSPEPQGVYCRVPDPPGHAAVQQCLQVTHRQPETVLRNDGQLFTAFIPRLQHRVTLLQGGRHGLFAYYIFPAVQCVDGNLRVYKRRCADIDQIDILVQDFMVVQVYFSIQMILFLDMLGLSGDNIHKGRDPAPFRKTQVCLYVSVRDAACSDDGYIDHFGYLTSYFLPFCWFHNRRKQFLLTI